MVGVARGHQRADTLKPYSQKTSQSNHTRTTALSNSMKPSHACGFENPMNSMKRQNDRIPKEELPRSLGAQYATADHWRNNSRKNKGMEPKQKQYPVVDVTGGRSQV